MMNITKSNATFSVTVNEINEDKELTFSKMLTTVDELKQLDITNEYASAAGVLFALATFEKDKEMGKQMLEFINGPTDVSGFDISFINEQLKQYPYVVRSYFKNTSPDNNYEVKDVTLVIQENPYSKDEEGYIRLWFKSSGADSKRALTLRQKGSTSEWFLFSDSYKGLLAGIKAPKNIDKWA